ISPWRRECDSKLRKGRRRRARSNDQIIKWRFPLQRFPGKNVPQVVQPAVHFFRFHFSLSKSAKVLPASANRFNNGEGSHNSPSSSWNWLTRSYTFFRPTVSAYHIGPPRQAG